MRPLLLKISAFGSYAGNQIIDFAELKGRTFFLIHGPTGAGKTTILDAICFALYGDASGEHRSSKSLRSDHADPAASTEVMFDFAVGQARYRVQRIPEQERLKRRGEGTTVQAAEATLWKLADDDTATLAVTGWGKVTERVEAILGFKSSQFRQVVLLPQGEFRKLLLADSKERQDIMQTLFKTDIYRAIEEMLKVKAQALKQHFEELKKQSGWVLQEANMSSLTDLQAAYADFRSKTQEAGRQVAREAELLTQAQAALTKGNMDQAKLAEREAARRELTALQAKTAVVNAKREELARARRAAGLADAEKALAQLENDVCVWRTKEQDYAQKYALARAELEAAERGLKTEREREPEREELARIQLQLNSIAERLTLLTEARERLQACATEQAALVQARQEAGTNQAGLEGQLRALQEERQRLLTLSLAETGWQYRCEQAQQILDNRRKLDEVRAQYRKLAACHDTLETQEKAKQAAYSAISATYQELQKRWLEGQAAVLAAELEADKPCPVCGSTVHPAKAGAGGDMPTEQQIKMQRALAEKLDEERRLLAGELGSCRTARDTAAHKLADLEQQLGEQAGCPLEELAQSLQECRAQLKQARDAQARLNTLEGELTQREVETAACAKQAEDIEHRCRQAQDAYKMAEAILAERQGAIPAAYQDAGELARARRAAEEKLVNAKRALETAQRRVEAAARQLSVGEEAYNQTAAAQAAAAQRLATEQEVFGLRLQEAGFADRAAYEQAKKADAYLETLEERIKAFDKTLAAAEERALRAEEEAANLEPPDIKALQQGLAAIRAQYELTLKEHTIGENTVKRQAAWLEKLAGLQEEMAKVEEDYRITGRLADAANGRNDFGLTFQRFVLGALLDDVAAAASQRLKVMSRGRYLLQRTMDRARKNAAGGLDLEIFDHYTGHTRGVNTLSGGETFLASLALALGLADVVQAYAGGMHLDTIFIDEGFGTLDPEALDFAVRALLDLQQGGRLVGIISHVPELKERIDARLEIKATDQGSTAHFHVG
mgnify:FL=1